MKQTLNEALRAIIIGSITIFIVTTFALFVASRAGAQEGQTLERKNNPHDNPACHTRGSSTAVRCSCTRMVHDAQQAIVKKCWALVGLDDPEGMTLQFAPPEVLECLEANEKAHCQIVAMSKWVVEAEYGITVKDEDRCGTECRPEHCHCGDEPCPEHGATELY